MSDIEKFIKKRPNDIKSIEYITIKTDESWITILKYAEGLDIPRIHYFKLPKFMKGVLVNGKEFWFRWKFNNVEHVCKFEIDDDFKKLITIVD